MNKDIVKEMLKILFNSLQIYIAVFGIVFVIFCIPVGVFFSVKYFFGGTVAAYVILGACVIGFLWMIIDSVIGWFKKTYHQARINLMYKKGK